MVTDREIIAAAKSLVEQGSHFTIFGRPKYQDKNICEVWLLNQYEYDTVFILHSDEKIEGKFRSFETLMQFLDTHHEVRGEVKIFISHAHKDVHIARKFVVALELGMNIPNGGVRCTSVPGYQIDLGSMPSSVLRSDLASAEVIIFILTPNSLSSEWVIFELGAAWLQEKQLVPLTLGGRTDIDIPGPYRGATSARLDDPAALTQLLEQLARKLRWARRNMTAANWVLNEIADYAVSLEVPDRELSEKLQRDKDDR